VKSTKAGGLLEEKRGKGQGRERNLGSAKEKRKKGRRPTLTSCTANGNSPGRKEGKQWEEVLLYFNEGQEKAVCLGGAARQQTGRFQRKSEDKREMGRQ